MNELLQLAIEAQGGLDQWRKFNTFTARFINSGALWVMKGHGGTIDEVGVKVNLLEQKTSHIPNEQWHTAYTPDRIAIESANGDTKEITRQKNLLFRIEDVHRFMEALRVPQNQRGSLLIQFPPSLQVSALSQLDELLTVLKAYTWPVATEFRHSSWYKDEIFELLNQHQVAMVLQDMPKSVTPLEITADDIVYLRFHGPSGNYKGSYSESVLYEYAWYISEWQQEGKTVYTYFNNTGGAALENLHFLKRCLAE